MMKTLFLVVWLSALVVRKACGFSPVLVSDSSSSSWKRTMSRTTHRSPQTQRHQESHGATHLPTCTSLAQAANTEGGKRKRKRRRKTTSTTDTPEQPAAAAQTTNTGPVETVKAPIGSTAPVLPDPIKISPVQLDSDGDFEDDDDDDDDDPTATLLEVANFAFQPDTLDTSSLVSPAASAASVDAPSDAIPLPDIREARKKKQKQLAEEALAQQQQEEFEQDRVRIKRTDKEAFRRLLEAQPFADADESYFEKEEYGTVSALLGEGAKPFLGIPTGPLQVGHLIGALGIVLMAFVEYPGFPLTNLPTPLRDALQGGLASVYAINLVLAVLASFKATERGQSNILWAVKTFAVGGIALDQLTQMPTLEQIRIAESRKGKRGLKSK